MRSPENHDLWVVILKMLYQYVEIYHNSSSRDGVGGGVLVIFIHSDFSKASCYLKDNIWKSSFILLLQSYLASTIKIYDFFSSNESLDSNYAKSFVG